MLPTSNASISATRINIFDLDNFTAQIAENRQYLATITTLSLFFFPVRFTRVLANTLGSCCRRVAEREIVRAAAVELTRSGSPVIDYQRYCSEPQLGTNICQFICTDA